MGILAVLNTQGGGIPYDRQVKQIFTLTDRMTECSLQLYFRIKDLYIYHLPALQQLALTEVAASSPELQTSPTTPLQTHLQPRNQIKKCKKEDNQRGPNIIPYFGFKHSILKNG
jgi:hypothetical protein